jgi:hypothetical protein
MVEALRETKLLILVMSENAVASKWVTQKWTTFLDMQKKIIPLRLRECEVPEAINRIEMIKTSHPKWYSRLLKSIEQNLRGRCAALP